MTLERYYNGYIADSVICWNENGIEIECDEVIFLYNKEEGLTNIDSKANTYTLSSEKVSLIFSDSCACFIDASIIEEESKGIVSYLRGENPLAFPMRLEPHSKNVNLIKHSQFPKLDFKGERINSDEMLNHLKLI